MYLSPIELIREAFELLNSEKDERDIFEIELEILRKLQMDVNIVVASDFLSEVFCAT